MSTSLLLIPDVFGIPGNGKKRVVLQNVSQVSLYEKDGNSQIENEIGCEKKIGEKGILLLIFDSNHLPSLSISSLI